MSRKLPRSFFWIDQGVIRNGAWLKLSAESRLAYIALAASCDREGISIWSIPKLMELAACQEREIWAERVIELEGHSLVEQMPEHIPPAIKLLGLEVTPVTGGRGPSARELSTAPIVVHTHTTIHLGGQAPHVESTSTD